MSPSFFEESDDIEFGQESKSSTPPKKTPQNKSVRTIPLAKQELSFDDSHSRKSSLALLLENMKPSFLPKEENKDAVRQICISEPGENKSPLFLIKKENTTLLFGTGFGEISTANKSYPSFPDMRLPFSEKNTLDAWIILDENINVELLTTILPVLDFPHIYTTRNNITNIRNSISDANILDKCRFFEIHHSDSSVQKIGMIDYGISKDGKYFCLGFNSRIFAYPYTSPSLALSSSSLEPTYIFSYEQDKNFSVNDTKFEVGEMMIFDKNSIERGKMKFTFDTFYMDEKSIGVEAGYVLSDREALSEGGVVVFTLQEDPKLKTIQGHIFIDSRGFVHRHEVMYIHKEIIKAVRVSYEQIRASEPQIDRGQLVQKLKKEITKYAYVLTGRTPVVMPVIVESNSRY